MEGREAGQEKILSMVDTVRNRFHEEQPLTLKVWDDTLREVFLYFKPALKSFDAFPARVKKRLNNDGTYKGRTKTEWIIANMLDNADMNFHVDRLTAISKFGEANLQLLKVIYESGESVYKIYENGMAPPSLKKKKNYLQAVNDLKDMGVLSKGEGKRGRWTVDTKAMLKHLKSYGFPTTLDYLGWEKIKE